MSYASKFRVFEIMKDMPTTKSPLKIFVGALLGFGVGDVVERVEVGLSDGVIVGGLDSVGGAKVKLDEEEGDDVRTREDVGNADGGEEIPDGGGVVVGAVERVGEDELGVPSVGEADGPGVVLVGTKETVVDPLGLDEGAKVRDVGPCVGGAVGTDVEVDGGTVGPTVGAADDRDGALVNEDGGKVGASVGAGELDGALVVDELGDDVEPTVGEDVLVGPVVGFGLLGFIVVGIGVGTVVGVTVVVTFVGPVVGETVVDELVGEMVGV